MNKIIFTLLLIITAQAFSNSNIYGLENSEKNKLSEISEIIVKDLAVTIQVRNSRSDTRVFINYKSMKIKLDYINHDKTIYYSDTTNFSLNKNDFALTSKLDFKVSLNNTDSTKGAGCSRAAVKNAMKRLEDAIASGASEESIKSLQNDIRNAFGDWLQCVLK